jgi:hypothetical protein
MKTILAHKLTDRQLTVLRECEQGDTIKDIRTLRKLALLGVVTLHEHTGEIVRHVWGMLVRAFYIDDADTFEIEGVGVFRHQYFSGCFFPYLIKAELDELGRVRC